jgi:hypothetical protein
MQTRTDATVAFVRSLPRRAAEWAQRHTRSLRRLIGAPYRPEKHYMRGPGPKWREKYAHPGVQRPSDASRAG